MMNIPGERAILVGLEVPDQNGWEVEESLAELGHLALTAGAEVVGKIMQKRASPHAAYLVGAGKAEEIESLRKRTGAGLVIFDQELTPAQMHNLEQIIEGRIVDRTQLILDIFAQRAQSREGKLQVELARLSYLLPRLAGRGTELSRLGGGIGTRGPGETKLEVDRREIRRRIRELQHEIERLRRHRSLWRRSRRRVPLPLAALVGYTNAGKSTLLNTLTGSSVLVEDRLFATLDPTIRRLRLPVGQEILVTDTVGFIHKLPVQLVAAFRATLEEVLEADLLLHVIDASHPKAREQVEAVYRVLEELGANRKPIITVFNKVDRLSHNEVVLPGKDLPDPVQISALYGTGIDLLLNRIGQVLEHRRQRVSFRIPYRHSGLVGLLHEKGKVLQEKYLPGEILVEVEIERVWADRVRQLLVR